VREMKEEAAWRWRYSYLKAESQGRSLRHSHQLRHMKEEYSSECHFVLTLLSDHGLESAIMRQYALIHTNTTYF